MKFTDREKAIKKEKQYAERRFTQLLAKIDQFADNLPNEQIEALISELDSTWRNFCKNLIYLKAGGEDEFMKVAHERAFKKIIV